ncbi:glycosyltransferase family 39 protein [Candidatus Parcubacteria bacterium]|nr:glycosyltransferase family 39 protein [Candidatus Parcubacteria bacterium]
MESRNTHFNNKQNFWILVGLILFVIILSLAVFSRQSLRLDEAQSLWQTSHTPTKILNILAQDVHVPLYHMVLHFWQLFLGSTVVTGRMLSLIFFALSIPAMYYLGKRAFNSSISIFATALLAISPFMNWYGNEMRMYSLFTLLTILSQYFFIGIYKKQDSDSWIGYFLVAFFGIFTHYFFWFVLLVQAIFYFMYKDLFLKGSLKRFISIAIILGLAFTPWIIYVQILGTVGNQAPILTIPNTVNVFNTFSQFIFGFQNDHLNTILVSLWPLTVLLGFLALRENERVSPEVIYMVMSVLIPIAAAFVVSVTLRPLFVSRYLILTIPSMYLLISWIFSTYPRPLRKALGVILIFAMLAGLAVEVINPSSPVKENYRQAADYLEQHASAQDVIVLSAPFTIYPVEYYYRGPTPVATLPIWNRYETGAIPPFDENKLQQEIDTVKGSHDKAYVLLSYDQGYEEKIRLYFETNFQRLELKEFSPGLKLYVYQLRYDKPIFGMR